MESIEPPRQPSQLLFTPLMISMVGIISTALAILLYKFIMVRYCPGRLSVRLSRRIQEGEKRAGVEEDVLDTIPVLAYTLDDGGLFRVDQTECAVCLCEFEEGEVVRLLPNCRHAFHVDCIDRWFFSHSNCPVCRTQIMAPLLSSEISVSLESAVVENDGANQDADASTESVSRAEIRSNRVLKYCASVVYVREKKLSLLPGMLKRSLSLDFSYVSNKIQRARERSLSSSSSSSSSMLSAIILQSKSSRAGSSKRLDRASTTLTNSFSNLRKYPGDASSGILPI